MKPATASRKYWENIGKRFVDDDDSETYLVKDVCTFGKRKGRYYYKCCVIAPDSSFGSEMNDDNESIEWQYKSCSLFESKSVATWLLD